MEGKKNFTFSIDPEIVEQAKKLVDSDKNHLYSSFNHFVQSAIISEMNWLKEAEVLMEEMKRSIHLRQMIANNFSKMAEVLKEIDSKTHKNFKLGDL